MNRFRGILLAALVLHVTSGLLGQRADVAGIIVAITSPVYLRTSSTGPEIQLHPQRDLGRWLIQGQAVRAGSTGKVTVQFPTGPRELTAMHGRYEILRPTTGLSAKERRLSDALNSFGRPAGSRGLQTPIYSPTNGGAVRPDRMIVRWTPDGSAASATFAVRGPDGEVIWQSGPVADGPGQLSSTLLAALRQALSARSAGQGISLTASLSRGAGVSSTSFRVLSVADQQAMEQQLAAYDPSAEPLVSAVGRSFELISAELFNEAADEWDRALAAMPSSEGVIRAAIEAHDRIGNAARVRQLTALLAAAPGRE